MSMIWEVVQRKWQERFCPDAPLGGLTIDEVFVETVNVHVKGDADLKNSKGKHWTVKSDACQVERCTVDQCHLEDFTRGDVHNSHFDVLGAYGTRLDLKGTTVRETVSFVGEQLTLRDCAFRQVVARIEPPTGEASGFSILGSYGGSTVTLATATGASLMYSSGGHSTHQILGGVPHASALARFEAPATYNIRDCSLSFLMGGEATNVLARNATLSSWGSQSVLRVSQTFQATDCSVTGISIVAPQIILNQCRLSEETFLTRGVVEGSQVTFSGAILKDIILTAKGCNLQGSRLENVEIQETQGLEGLDLCRKTNVTLPNGVVLSDHIKE